MEASGRHRSDLVVTTLGDEIKATGPADTEVIGISLKDRAAILPAGHAANAAYWFEHESGQFVTSTYYMKELPAWVQAFNKSDAVSKYASAKWATFRTLPAVLGKPYYEAMIATPYGNDMLEAFAEDAHQGGASGAAFGDGRADGELFEQRFAGASSGAGCAGSARHVHPDRSRAGAIVARGGSGGRRGKLRGGVHFRSWRCAEARGIDEARDSGGAIFGRRSFSSHRELRLREKYGPGKWIVGRAELAPYLDHDLLREKHAVLAEAQEIAAEAVRKLPYIFRVYTGAQLEHENLAGDPIGTLDATRLLSRPGSGFVHRSKALLAGVAKRHFAWDAVQLRYACAGDFLRARHSTGAIRRKHSHGRYRANAGRAAGSEYAERIGGASAADYRKIASRICRHLLRYLGHAAAICVCVLSDSRGSRLQERRTRQQ